MSSYVSALVIQYNNDPFVDDVSLTKSAGNIFPSGIGKTMAIPCPDSTGGGIIDGDYWATPVNEGIVSGFTFTPYNVAEVVSTKPDVQSFAVVRISTRYSRDVYYVLGTSTQYLASCSVCCADSPILMPVANDITDQAPCFTICQTDADGNYFLSLGLPSLTPGVGRYYPYGYFNDVALPTASATGYVNTDTLLTFLNTAVTGWAAVGTWTVSNGSLIVTQTSGPGTDVLCAAVVDINPSA